MDGDGRAIDELLANAGLPFDVTTGALYVNVEETATGDLTKHRIDIRASHTTIQDFIDELNAIDHVSADLDASNRLRIVADGGFGFDFSRRLEPVAGRDRDLRRSARQPRDPGQRALLAGRRGHAEPDRRSRRCGDVLRDHAVAVRLLRDLERHRRGAGGGRQPGPERPGQRHGGGGRGRHAGAANPGRGQHRRPARRRRHGRRGPGLERPDRQPPSAATRRASTRGSVAPTPGTATASSSSGPRRTG